MSGGTFEYDQYKLKYIADIIEQEVRDNGSEKAKEDMYDPSFYIPYSEETIKEFKKGIEYLKIAEIYAQRIDWLLAGDDGEDSFHRRLKEDLENLTLNSKYYDDMDNSTD